MPHLLTTPAEAEVESVEDRKKQEEEDIMNMAIRKLIWVSLDGGDHGSRGALLLKIYLGTRVEHVS